MQHSKAHDKLHLTSAVRPRSPSRPPPQSCDTWKAALPFAPRSWDDGIQGIVLAHVLFGVQPLGQRPPNIALRCGSAREHAPAEPCHDHKRPHCAHVLEVNDIRSRALTRKRRRHESFDVPE